MDTDKSKMAFRLLGDSDKSRMSVNLPGPLWQMLLMETSKDYKQINVFISLKKRGFLVYVTNPIWTTPSFSGSHKHSQSNIVPFIGAGPANAETQKARRAGE